MHASPGLSTEFDLMIAAGKTSGWRETRHDKLIEALKTIKCFVISLNKEVRGHKQKLNTSERN